MAGGRLTTIQPDRANGQFHARLPAGKYLVQAGAGQTSLSLVPGGSYDLDLRPGRHLAFHLEHQSAGDGRIEVKAIASGAGRHRLAIRGDNLDIAEAQKDVDLTRARTQTISWHGRIRSKTAPWVVVVFPNGDLTWKKDLIGFADGTRFE
jgi:hypothetical protein